MSNTRTVVEVPAEVFDRIVTALDSMATPRHAAVRLLTVKQTAAYLSRTEDWVRRHLTRRIPPVNDGELRFDIADLDHYIATNKRQSLG
jgi:hypothetical protein